MRTELERMEIIDRYLMNAMNNDEKIAFEKEMAADSLLAEQVKLQSDLLQGMARMQVLNTVQSAQKSYQFAQLVKLIGITVASIALIATATLAVVKARNEVAIQNNAVLEKPFAQKVMTQDYLPVQTFDIDNTKDTMLKSEHGMLFVIEKGTFGQHKNIQLKLKEAFSAKEILLSKLSTSSQGNPLETAGMFEWTAQSNGKNIEPEKEILVSIPTDDFKEDMKIFKGEVTESGTIDWREPQELEQFVPCVDILSLNFYPPCYQGELDRLGYGNATKHFKDSLYYAFSAEIGTLNEYAHIVQPEIAGALEVYYGEDSESYRNINADDEKRIRAEVAEYNRKLAKRLKTELIDPVKIKAIWNAQFNNTILATKAFEERLSFIFLTSNSELLELYVNNLDKPIYMIDSMAAVKEPLAKKEFLQFAAQRLGRVKTDDTKASLLREYYQKQEAEYKEAILKANALYEEKHAEAKQKADKISSDRYKAVNEMVGETFMNELQMNLKEAYRQLGYQPAPPMLYNYTFPVRNTGWFNVDKYVLESTTNRTTLDYTDPLTGKTAIIRYDSIKVSVTNDDEFEETIAYIIPNNFSTFLLLQKENNQYAYSCNELIDYSVLFIAYKGDQPYYQKIESAKAMTYEITLQSISQNELEMKLSLLDKKSGRSNFKRELDFILSQQQEQKRKKAYQANRDLMRALAPCIFPLFAEGSALWEEIIKSPRETEVFDGLK